MWFASLNLTAADLAFTSLNFAVFVAIAFILNFTVFYKKQWVLLLIASLVFYALCDRRALVFLLSVVVISFFSALVIEKINNKKKSKWLITLAILLLFSLLSVLKYFHGPVMAVFPSLKLFLPLGISFYTFQAVGYIIDIYRGKYAADRNIFKLCLFLSFFPQIVQGPIGRYDRLAGQLYENHKFSFDNLKFGIQLILWGLFKKMLIADRLSLPVAEIYGNYQNYSGGMIAFGVLCYCFQIYADFSSGIDIARGVARCFGIELDQNFKRPFFADSLSNFWRRWHITLGSWMRDYLFYPISLSKGFARMGRSLRKTFGPRTAKILPPSFASFIVFTVIGIWHGSSLKFFAFGLYNATIITASLLLEPFFESCFRFLKINRDGALWKGFAILRTFVLVFIGRYFTRGISLTAALTMMKKTFAPTVGEFSKLGLNISDYVIVLLALLTLLVIGLIQESGKGIRSSLEKKNGFVQVLVMTLLMLSIVLFGIYREGYIASQFIYAQF